MRILTLALLFLVLASAGHGQLLFFENFSYTSGTTLTSNGWVAHSGAGTNAQTVGANSLSYSGYSGSGVGNSVSLLTSGEDVDSALSTPINSGTAYASLLVRVDSATVAGDYFFHFIANSRTSNIFMARLFAKKGANGNLTFGISKSSTSATNPMVYSDSIYSIGTTYLVVVKYAFLSGSATDDAVSLFVFGDPVLPALEPGTPAVGPIAPAQTDATSLSFVAIRQGTAANAPMVAVDAIRIGLSWNDAPLPVQLASFTASRTNANSVRLAWTTTSEVNNYGFYVQRKGADGSEFADLHNGFVPGNGTTILTHHYSFDDNSVQNIAYTYRLRQVDNDGSVHYSDPVYVNNVTGVSLTTPAVFALSQNYPNPFNPSTEIRFSVEKTARTSLEVFNLLGQKVATLFADNAEAGRSYSVKLDGKSLVSGLYMYRLQSGNNVEIRKMLLLK